jgi:hypothetical protein
MKNRLITKYTTSSSTAYVDANFLKLDCSNGPLTNTLQISSPSNSAHLNLVPVSQQSITPSDGDLYADTSQGSLWYSQGIPTSLVRNAFCQSSLVTIDNTSTETTLLSGVGTLTLPADFLTVGKTIRFRVMGDLVKAGGSANTLTVRVKLNSVEVITFTRIFTTLALTTNFWQVDGCLTCYSTGTTGTVFGQALQTALTANVNTATSTVNTTIAQTFDITAQWTSAISGHTIECSNSIIEVLH